MSTTATHEPCTPATSIRRAGAVAGLALLGIVVLSIYAYGITIGGVVVDGDAAATAGNIADDETGFRWAIAAFAVIAMLDVVVGWALRTVFAPVSAMASSVQATLRIAYAAVLLVATSHLALAAQLATDGGDAAGFTARQAQAQALLQVDSFTTVWNAGLVLFGMHLLVLAHLVVRSSYVPTVIGVLLVPAGLGYIADAAGLLLIDGYDIQIGAVTFVGEAVLMLWLLARARRITVPGLAERTELAS